MMKALLVQARRLDDPMLEHERLCFARVTRLGSDGLSHVNLADRVPELAEVCRYDVMLVGGSGSYSAARSSPPFLGPALELMRRVVEAGHPTFASCFGYQLIVVALGGRVIRDCERREIGAHRVALTRAAAGDQLFSQLPPELVVQMGHEDRAVAMPDGIVNLARSALSPFQALRVIGAPVWATQFQPELGQDDTHTRYVAYIERYDPDGVCADEGGYRSLPSPEAATLLPSFLDLVRG